MVERKTNADTIILKEFSVKNKQSGETKIACEFQVDDSMRPNTVSIHGNMYPVYKREGQYYLKINGKKYYNGCVFLFPFNIPLSHSAFNKSYTIV